MIWKKEHITPQNDLYSYSQTVNKTYSPPAEAHTVAIVGGGPKGMYAVNHFANQMHLNPTTRHYELLWFNQDEYFACGPNYHIHQPDYLLINYCIGHVQAFHPAYRNMESQKTFVDWLNTVKTVDTTVKPTDFASRALVGHYLQWVAMETLRNLPYNIHVKLIPQSVIAVSDLDAQATIQTHSGQWTVNSVLLTTGHCYHNGVLIDQPNIPDVKYIRSPYPVSQFSELLAQSSVGVIGMGLTFIDIALALTEGRGGSFEQSTYHRSGKEPTIYPFSRTSLPILCRGPQYQMKRPLHILTASQFEKWMSRSVKIDFVKEVLPLIEEEVQLAYYGVAFDLASPDRIREKIQDIPVSGRFTLDDLLQPALNNEEEIIQYIRTNIDEARKGEERSPLMAAAAVWSNICTPISSLYQTVGFTGASQQQLDQYYFGAFNRVSYGPPISNMEKIYALAKAGVIRFTALANPTIRWQADQHTFSVRDSNGKTMQLDYLIDARIGRPALQKRNAVLYDNLLLQASIRAHENEGYRPGNMSVDIHGKCTTISGLPFYCYGSNTEGIFFDNDTLSRTKNDTACYWIQETLRQI